MRISIILAMDEKRGIGYKNRLPWHLPADLRHFRIITLGHHIIMGRKTFQSIGKPLMGRQNIILTRNLHLKIDGCIMSHSLNHALEIARSNGEDEVFIIGGGEIYSQSLPLADRIYLTLVHTDSDSDIYFPEINESEWQLTHSRYYPADEENKHPMTFKLLDRKK